MSNLLSKTIAILDAPSNLGLKQLRDREPGVWQMPQALRKAGLVEGLGARDGGVVPRLPYVGEIDPESGVRNADALREYSLTLADAVGTILDAGHFPLVLGGDCSILIGNMLALRRRGRYGLFFIDGHTDFLNATTSYTKAAAGMDLALVTGHGHDKMTSFKGFKPLVHEEDTVAFGFRDVEDPSTYVAREIFETGILCASLDKVRNIGIRAAVDAALERFRHNEVDGFWIHLDVDVLDSEIMPAVDSPQPDGLRYDELIDILRLLLGSGLAVGMEVTIFDPDLDPEGKYARELAQALVQGIGSRANT
jgi:arginase